MRKQRAFATLTAEEIDLISKWLRHDNYDHVRERIARPRPDGFGLIISNKPLQILFARKNTVDQINRKIETGQKLTLSEFESILGSAGVPPAPKDASSEISSSAESEKSKMHNVQSMKSAENPRVLQIHTAILEAAHDLATSSDNTPTQLLALQKLADFPARADYRAHKIQMDLHRKEMAEHRKTIATERLALARESIDLRRNQLAAFPAKNPSEQNQKSEIRNPKFELWTSDDIIHNQPKVEAAIQRDPFLSQIGLPPEPIPTPTPTPNLNPTPPNPSPAESNIPETLEQRVNKYTLARHHEALVGKDPTKVGRSAAFNFHSAMEHCPCGQHLPCPHHGDFPPRFFEISPDHADYFHCLEKKKIPFTSPHELLRREAEKSTEAIEAPSLDFAPEKVSDRGLSR